MGGPVNAGLATDEPAMQYGSALRSGPPDGAAPILANQDLRPQIQRSHTTPSPTMPVSELISDVAGRGAEKAEPQEHPEPRTEPRQQGDHFRHRSLCYTSGPCPHNQDDMPRFRPWSRMIAICTAPSGPDGGRGRCARKGRRGARKSGRWGGGKGWT